MSMQAVSSSKLWGGVLASQPVPGEQLHKLYQSHLQGFAQHHAHGPDPSQLIRHGRIAHTHSCIPDMVRWQKSAAD